MKLYLAADDLRRLTAASEALLSPLAGPSPDAWWRSAERALRELFPGANAMLTLPQGGALRFHSESVDADARRRLAELTAADPRTGRFRNHDPSVEAWHRYQRARRLVVWSEGINRRIYARLGHDFDRSAYIADGLHAAGLRDYAGLTTYDATGELFLTVGYDRRGGSRRGHETDVALLGLLLPGLRAGHHALATFGARQAALAATLDAAPDALLVLAPDGRELHRSAALVRLLAAEPERDSLVARMTAMAADCSAARTAARRAHERGAPPCAAAQVVTALARYDVRAAFGSPALWGTEGVVQLCVTPCAAAACAPAVAAVAAVAALSPREAEVAALLARRATDVEVAAALGVSWHTARRHAERVLQKLGVRSRLQVAAALGGAGAASLS